MSTSKANIMSVIPEELITSQGKISKKEALNSKKLIGVYFGGYWCPPCQMFSQTLMSCYNEINSKEKQVEIIYCSSDEDIEDFHNYTNDTPWLSIPFESKVPEKLISQYKISGIPTLLIFNRKGKLIEKAGRRIVQEKGVSAFKEWLKK